MPAPLAVDKEAVRVLVLAVGVREAARRMDLNEETVAAWSARGKWLEGKAELASAISGASTPARMAVAEQLPASMRPVPPASGASISPAMALSDVMSDDSRETKLAGSRYARRVIEHVARVAEESPADALKAARNAKEAIGIASTVHGWGEQAGGAARISIYGSQVVIADRAGE